MANSYVLGQTVRLRAELRGINDEYLDASAVRCLVIGPTSPTVSSLPVTGDGLGRIFADVQTQVPGTWRYRFETTSGVAVAGEGSFEITARGVPVP